MENAVTNSSEVTDTDSRMLFLPTSISVLVIRADLTHTILPPDDVQFGLGLEIRGLDSVWLILYCFQEDSTLEEAKPLQVCESCRLILDCLTDIRREGVTQRSDGHVTEILFTYRRLSEVLSFEAIVSGPDGFTELHALDFLLGQYAIKENIIDRDVFAVSNSDGGQDHNNVVAKGIEHSGVIVRRALKTSGEYTGHLIRYLGRKFTEVTVSPTTVPIPADDIDPRLLAEAQRRREWAEGFNSGARTLTSTILYPVRWTGQKAAKMAQVDHHLDHNLDARERNLVTHRQRQSLTGSAAHSVKKALWDTVEGVGNGVTSIFKGVTEAMAEVGSAIGDSAMHHARVKYGDSYANQVTKSYVDAASEIGLAGYKVANVFSFGIAGLMIDVVVEGTTLLVSLYDYLVGPVILQGYMTLVQPPLLAPTRYFVVLRPWSLAFYRSPRDVVHKPFKIVPTFLLDTIPRLRNPRRRSPTAAEGDDASGHSATAADSAAQPEPPADQSNATGESFVEETPATATQPTMALPTVHSDAAGLRPSLASALASDEEGVSIIEADGLSYIVMPTAAASEAAPATAAPAPEPAAAATSAKTAAGAIGDVLRHWAGGDRPHVELTTIDCSTYLLYPEVSAAVPALLEETRLSPEALLQLWFAELETAVRRVETLARRRSGAVALAYHKRLRRMPKELFLELQPVRFVFLQHKATSTAQTLPAATDRRRTSGKASHGDGPALATAAVATSAPSAAVDADFSLLDEDDVASSCGDGHRRFGVGVAAGSTSSIDALDASRDDVSPVSQTSSTSRALTPTAMAERAVQNMTGNFRRYQRLFTPAPATDADAGHFDSIVSDADAQQDYRLDAVFAEQDERYRWQQSLAMQSTSSASLASAATVDEALPVADAVGDAPSEPVVIVRRSPTKPPRSSGWLAAMTAASRPPPRFVSMSATPIARTGLVLREESCASASAAVTSLTEQLDALRVLLLNNSPQSLGAAEFNALSRHVQQFEAVASDKDVVEWQFQRYLRWMGIEAPAAAAAATADGDTDEALRPHTAQDRPFLRLGSRCALFDTQHRQASSAGKAAVDATGRVVLTLHSSTAPMADVVAAAAAKTLGSASLSLADLQLPSTDGDADGGDEEERELWLPVLQTAAAPLAAGGPSGASGSAAAGELPPVTTEAAAVDDPAGGKQIGNLLIRYRIVRAAR